MSEFKKAVEIIQTLLKGTDGWTASFMENHDVPRSISHFASDKPEHRVQSGKLLALLNGSLSGTLYIYQGQEIGMINMPTDWPIDEYKDVSSINYYANVKKKSNNDPKALQKAKMNLQYIARDNARLPMSWDSSPQGGFSTNPETWMRTHDLAQEINVAKQEKNENSVLGFWKRMLKIRKEYSPLFVYGDFQLLGEANDDPVFLYTKRQGDNTCLVVMNFSENEVDWVATDLAKTLLISTYEEPAVAPSRLRPYEGRIYMYPCQ